ncbi:MFS transporter [Actinomadura viridis]|uniref:MFS transporter n=1 Tax=Actinomadura viridis TaxID=58110 RepID=UPI00367C180B
MTRGPRTLGLYAAMGCLGYLLAALGAILPELRAERGLPRGEAALYPSAFALGLVVVGLFGHRLAPKAGRYALPASLTALVGGAALLALGDGRLTGGTGALVLGFGGAGLVQLVPAALRETADPRAGAVAIGEANAVSSAASVLAPLLVGFALAHGLGWRAAFAGLPLAAAALPVIVLLRHGTLPAPTGPEPPAAGPAPPAGGRAPALFRSRWVDLVLAVSVEFCVLFWAADFLHTFKGLERDTATTASAAFVLGMAAGRATTGRAVRLGQDRLLTGATAVAALGFALFWAVPSPVPALGGLLLTGLGVALLYPLILAQALAAWPGRPAHAAARCALASGVAIGTGPPLLGALADLTDLRTAALLTLVLLLALLIRRTRLP